MQQDEQNQKIVVLTARATKMTGELLHKMIKLVLIKGGGKLFNKTFHTGKQTYGSLMKSGAALSNIEINDGNIKSFEKIAKKYKIDFSLKKDKSLDPPMYCVFFKGKDIDVITRAFKDFTDDKVKGKKKESVLDKIKKLQEKVKKQVKDKVKLKEKEQTL